MNVLEKFKFKSYLGISLCFTDVCNGKSRFINIGKELIKNLVD